MKTNWIARRLVYAALFVNALLIRSLLFDYESLDYTLYLSEWYDHFLRNGRWSGLALTDEKYASYPPLYMCFLSLLTLVPVPKLYAIKALSVLFELFCMIAIVKLCRRHFPSVNGPQVALSMLFLPTVIMNGSLWGQCDMMYTSLLVFSLFFLSKQHSAAAVFAAALAFCLKPQAVFWWPILLACVFATMIRPVELIIFPVTFFVAGLPEILAGRPTLDVMLHWFNVHPEKALSLNAPNVYQVLGCDETLIVAISGVLATVVITLVFAWWLAKHSYLLKEPKALLGVAMLSLLYPPFFLPGMHERYFFAADVVSLMYAAVFARGWIILVLVQCASAFSYTSFLFNVDPVPGMARALLVWIAMCLCLVTLVNIRGQLYGKLDENGGQARE